jgi:hypothetical protein
VAALAVCFLWACAHAETATARFKSVQEISWPIEYADGFFDGNGQAYQQKLARSSLGMALSAMRKADVDLSQKGDNILAYLSELGFSDPRLDEFDVEPTIDTIASAIAAKSVESGGERFTVIAVAISGGGYKDEWKSNFLIGSGTQHEGFNQAAEKVIGRLQSYIQDHGITGHTKIWISGYSRAAATANRAAAILLDEKMVPAEDLFAYTFATPNVTRQQDAASYPSIFNIIGSFDPVPMIPFDEWGYSRFGTTYYLPSSETNSDYNQRVQPVEDVYYKMTGETYWVNESGDLLLQKVYGTMSSMVTSVDDYVDHYQSLFMQVWDDKENPLKLVTGVVGTLLGDSDLLEQLIGEADDAWSVVTNAVSGLILQAAGLSEDEWSDSAGVGENLAHEHFPKGYLAWLSAYDNLDSMISRNQRYRQIGVGGCSAIRIYNEQGELATDYELEGATAKVGDADLFPVVWNGDEMVVTVPADRAYRIELTAESAQDFYLVIREDKIGASKTRNYETREFAAAGTAYACRLPAASASGEEGYTVEWSGGSASLTEAEESSFLDKLEVDSSAKTILSQDLKTVVQVIVMLILQLLFLTGMSIRAAVRHRRRARLGKTVPAPVHLHRLRFTRSQPVRALVKVLAACLSVVAALVLTECVSSAITWFNDSLAIDQSALFWFLLSVSVPPILMMAFSALPALFAAFFAILWPEEDPYSLKTAHLCTFFALLCTAALVAYVMTDPNAQVHVAHRSYPVILLALLSAEWILSLMALRVERKKKAAAVNAPSKV